MNIKISNILVSTFSNIRVTKDPITKPLLEILEEIKKGNPELKRKIKTIRNEKDHGKQSSYKVALLPIFCVSGLFSERKDYALIQMSGAICIDLDDVVDIKAEKERLKQYNHVLSVFVSPSGNGLKVIVLHDLTDLGFHKEVYSHIGTQLGLTGRVDLKFDSSCSNVSRACFMSYDTGLYLNKEATPLHVEKSTLYPSLPEMDLGEIDLSYSVPTFDNILCPSDTNLEIKRDVVIDTFKATATTLSDLKEIRTEIIESHTLFEEYYPMYPGVRNTNLFILASFFKDRGIPEDSATDYLVAYYCDPENSFTAPEIESTVKSAYLT